MAPLEVGTFGKGASSGLRLFKVLFPEGEDLGFWNDLKGWQQLQETVGYGVSLDMILLKSYKAATLGGQFYCTRLPGQK